MGGEMNETDRMELQKTLHGIELKLGELNSFLQNHTVLTKERMENQQKSIDLLNEEIFGGKYEGIKVTLDRIVQTEKTRRTILMSMGAAIIGLVVKAFWSGLAYLQNVK